MSVLYHEKLEELRPAIIAQAEQLAKTEAMVLAQNVATNEERFSRDEIVANLNELLETAEQEGLTSIYIRTYLDRFSKEKEE